jgi:hypothetical protein
MSSACAAAGTAARDRDRGRQHFAHGHPSPASSSWFGFPYCHKVNVRSKSPALPRRRQAEGPWSSRPPSARAGHGIRPESVINQCVTLEQLDRPTKMVYSRDGDSIGFGPRRSFRRQLPIWAPIQGGDDEERRSAHSSFREDFIVGYQLIRGISVGVPGAPAGPAPHEGTASFLLGVEGGVKAAGGEILRPERPPRAT